MKDVLANYTDRTAPEGPCKTTTMMHGGGDLQLYMFVCTVVSVEAVIVTMKVAVMEVEQKTRRSDGHMRECEDTAEVDIYVFSDVEHALVADDEKYSDFWRIAEHLGKVDGPSEGSEPAERLGAIVKHKNVEGDNLAAVGGLDENSPTRPWHYAYLVDGYFCFGIGNASANWKEAQRSQLNSPFLLARWPRLE